MSHQVWILGATGRTGRAIARSLNNEKVPLVLAGREAARLQSVADELDGGSELRVGTLEQLLRQLTQSGAAKPEVVINTVGPFAATARQVARACPPGTHYVDLSNELSAAQDVLALDRSAAAGAQTFVTGAGFGVLATEAVVLSLCHGRSRPTTVRTDALAAVGLADGVVGTALAATIVEVIAAGGREVRGGRLARASVGGHFETITTPDGDVLTTGGGANAELIAAWRASGADTVIAASAAAPSNPVVRAMLPAVCAIVRLPGVGRLAAAGIGRIPLRERPMPRTSSFGHARVSWADGQEREGWLRTADGTDFTAAVVTQVTTRLLNGEGRPGAFTPGALFGPELATACGAVFLSAEKPPKPTLTDPTDRAERPL